MTSNIRNQGADNIYNVETTEILDYISTAMRTLVEFEKRLKQRQNTSPTHSATL